MPLLPKNDGINTADPGIVQNYSDVLPFDGWLQSRVFGAITYPCLELLVKPREGADPLYSRLIMKYDNISSLIGRLARRYRNGKLPKLFASDFQWNFNIHHH